MKKVYSKPQIMFENFSLSTNIAAACEVRANTQSNFDSCGVDFSGDIVFATSTSGCKDKIDDYGQYNSICYHVPSDSNNIFNS